MSDRRPAELDDLDRYPEIFGNWQSAPGPSPDLPDRIMRAIDAIVDAREKLEQRDQELLDRLRQRQEWDQADGFLGDDEGWEG